jgi:hypothetical protein
VDVDVAKYSGTVSHQHFNSLLLLIYCHISRYGNAVRA